MCGFAGCWTADPITGEVLCSAVERMTAPIQHRGPDDSGVWCEPAVGLGLGFRRLAIIDLTAHGHQPMRSAQGRYTMVFNGEVYNFEALRDVLRSSGARFEGRSDSEVILAAFEAWGVEASLPRFVGMFAIAVWDAQEKVLHLTRDRFGKKPLYTYWEPGYLSFGSELKSLVAGLKFDRSADHEALAAYLRYLYVPAPATAYRRARKLMPGHLLSIRRLDEALPASRPYWSMEDVAQRGLASPFAGSDEEGIDALESILSDAVRLRMVADVPLGAFLSGGIDSSTTVALMQANSTRPIRTFSVGFDEREYDEADDARAVASHLGTDHTTIRLTGDDALALVPQLPDWFDEPLADPSQLPTYLICRESRRDVTVAISGDGGDELFGGYNRYLFGEDVISPSARLPRVARGAAAAVAHALPVDTWDALHRVMSPALPKRFRTRLPGDKLHKMGNLMRHADEAEMYRSLVSALQRPELLMPGTTDRDDVVLRILRGAQPKDLLDRMMLADQLGYLIDDLLGKVDRVSMAVSLEVRVPLLDHRVAEFAWSLPRRFKIRDGQSKWILRKLLHRHVPPALVERPKMGFSVPIDRWLRGPLRAWAEDLLSPDSLRASGLVAIEPTRTLWQDFDRGRASGLGMWAVLNLLAWQRRWQPTV